jgi:hypothetical protein
VDADHPLEAGVEVARQKLGDVLHAL